MCKYVLCLVKNLLKYLSMVDVLYDFLVNVRYNCDAASRKYFGVDVAILNLDNSPVMIPYFERSERHDSMCGNFDSLSPFFTNSMRLSYNFEAMMLESVQNQIVMSR